MVANIDHIPAGARPVILGAEGRRYLLLMLVVLLVARLLLVFWLPVIDPTEGRYIEIARKMLETGDWITPQFDYGVPFWGKPPLHTWLSALGMMLFGVGHFGGRIFIFLTAIATLWLVHGWARLLWGRDAALAAAVVMVSSLVFFGAAGFVATDMVMVFGTTLCMVAFHRCVSNDDSRRLWGRLVFVGLAVGILAKGPTAVVLAGIPLFIWVLLGNRWRLLLRLPWGSGLVLLVVLTALWYVAAELKTPGFLRCFIIGEHYERFVVPGWTGDLYGSGHARPKGLIWVYGLAFFMPWTVFALILLARARRVVLQARAINMAANGAASYLLLWAISPLLLFSPAANILPSYVLPGIPAASVLLAVLCLRVWTGPGHIARTLSGMTLGLMSAIYVLLAGLAVLAPLRLSPNSEMELVEQARSLDAEMQLTYWGGRSYSGEFYSRGRARTVAITEALVALFATSARDAIAVGPDDFEMIRALLGDRFVYFGQFGRQPLFAEPG